MPLTRYTLDVTYTKGGHDRRLITRTQATGDAEAMRACHPLSDIAEWEGANDVCVRVTAEGGRAVGSVGDCGEYPDIMDRPERLAETFIPDPGVVGWPA